VDHGWLDAKDRQDHKAEVIIRRDNYVVTGRPGKLSGVAFRVLRSTHLRRRESEAGVAADSNLEILFVGFGQALIVRQADDDAAGLVFDGGDARLVNFGVLVVAAAGNQAVVRAVNAVAQFILTSGREAHAESSGVFNDEPGIEQPRVLEDPDQQEQEHRQDQGKFQHALGR
jgi:hypothetical protein